MPGKSPTAMYPLFTLKHDPWVALCLTLYVNQDRVSLVSHGALLQCDYCTSNVEVRVLGI